MRKEVLVAITIGALLGLAVAFGIFRANQALTPKTQTLPSPVPQQEEQSSGLIVTSPENERVTSEDKVVLRGSTTPAATVVILYNLGEVIVEARADGTFEQEIELEGGANEIKVISIDDQGASQEQTITVVYSTEFPSE